MRQSVWIREGRYNGPVSFIHRAVVPPLSDQGNHGEVCSSKQAKSLHARLGRCCAKIMQYPKTGLK
jgi:hypothetical protein